MRAIGLLTAYRAAGADPPFGSPSGYHGIAMEGHFWRFTHAASGTVVVAIVAISRDGTGRPWAMASLGVQPHGAVHSATLGDVSAARRRLALRAGSAVSADERSLRIDLGPQARLDVTLADRQPWPRRAFGALGPAHAVPRLSQYWHPWLLNATVTGRARIGNQEIGLDGATAYAEKNWGAGGMPERWWWGHAHAFEDRSDVCVAFAGGRAGIGRVHPTATALVVAVGPRLWTVVRPLRPLRVNVDAGGWHVAGGGIEVEGHADGAPILLPVPVPHERRRLDDWAPQHRGRLRVRVRRRGRVVYEGTSALAALERGRGVAAEHAG